MAVATGAAAHRHGDDVDPFGDVGGDLGGDDFHFHTDDSGFLQFQRMPQHAEGFLGRLADGAETADPGGLGGNQSDMAVHGNVGIAQLPDPFATPRSAVHAISTNLHVTVAQLQRFIG